MTPELDLESTDASALLADLRGGRRTAQDAVAASLARIERLNPRVNAIVTLDAERAMNEARAADARLAAGQPAGLLHGLPITVKDAIFTEGMRTTAGHAPLRDQVPERDATAVARLRAAGAIVIGKTNCATLCSDLQTNNPVFGRTSNPWNASRTAGGSSGGDAAAVALGLVPLGIGTDTGGSIRVPAAYCGVYGFKPSLAAVPGDGVIPPLASGEGHADSLTTIGPIARSVRDLRLAYRVLSGDALADAPAPAATRIAWTDPFAAVPVDDSVRAALARARDLLSATGLQVERREPPFDPRRVNYHYLLLSLYEFTPRELKPGVHFAFRLAETLRSLFGGGLAGSYAKVKAWQRTQIDAYQAFADGIDAWVIPATPTVAFPHQSGARALNLVSEGKRVQAGYWNAAGGYAFAANLLGCPSVTIPIGQDAAGLPIALQALGRPGGDAALLRAAEAIAERIGTVRTPPGN